MTATTLPTGPQTPDEIEFVGLILTLIRADGPEAARALLDSMMINLEDEVLSDLVRAHLIAGCARDASKLN
jgi:hypothetical protein